MYLREIAQVLKRFSEIYPIVGITGPRQSGKTTLARSLFPHLPYVSLENLDVREQAQQDPRAFLKKYEAGAILDEVQHTPELLSYLQEIVDLSIQKGRYVLTGSQNFSLNASIAQSLSGRIGMTTLLPLSLQELSFSEDISSHIFKGGYPRLHDSKMHPNEFYPSYTQTYIERDVRQLKNIENFNKFQTFLKLCAGRIGQVINFTSLAQDCGISHTTARQWLTILEASYLIFLVSPFHQNFNKRLIKMPKLYFYDTGLVCNLLRIEQFQQLETHYLKGALFENIVMLELLKHRLNKGLASNLYYWKDQTGHEIDCILEGADMLKAIEIKAATTFNSSFIDNLKYFCNLSKVAKGYLIYNGTQTGSFKSVDLIPIRSILNVTL